MCAEPSRRADSRGLRFPLGLYARKRIPPPPTLSLTHACPGHARQEKEDSEEEEEEEEGDGAGRAGDPDAAVQDFLGKGPLHSMLGGGGAGGGGGKGKGTKRGATLVSKDGVSELSVGSGGGAEHGAGGDEDGDGGHGEADDDDDDEEGGFEEEEEEDSD